METNRSDGVEHSESSTQLFADQRVTRIHTNPLHKSVHKLHKLTHGCITAKGVNTLHTQPTDASPSTISRTAAPPKPSSPSIAIRPYPPTVHPSDLPTSLPPPQKKGRTMASSSTSQPLRTSLQALFRSTLRTSLRQSRHSRGFSTRRISTRPGFPTISSTTTTITPHHQALLHRFTIPLLRRYATTLPPTAGVQPTQAPPSLLIRMWNSPVGVKTVHFWAPVMKWALVIAGISDFYRPPEKLSLTQSAALTATGLIWTRWCLIIKPKNYL